MKAKLWFIAIIPIVMLAGCATRGRLSALDIDLRTPEQTLAYQNEADVVYGPDSFSNPTSMPLGAAKIEQAQTIPWDIIVKLVEVVKGRIRILSFEWRK